jgi:hypothetical protein
MLSYKFSLLTFLLFTFSINGHAAFTDMECLNGNFESTVSHKVLMKFDRTINLVKKNCIIVIDYKKYNTYLGSKWIIDICRAPIHIKEDNGGIRVIKKTKDCQAGSGGDFCKELDQINKVIQDDGLIFADGEKEELSTDHGRVHCSNLLLQAYLQRDIIFSREKEYKNVLRGPHTKVIPPKIKVIAPIMEKSQPADVEEEVEIIKSESESAPEVDSSGAGGDF